MAVFVLLHPSEIINILDRDAVGKIAIGAALAIFEIC